MNWYGRSLASGCLAALAGAVRCFAAPAQAQAYPTRSITMIVPFAAGGPTDVIARIVTGHMAQTLGQSIIIENVVGAGGTTATTRAARAANDGYTLITGHMGTHAASVPLYPKLAYHPEKDFEPVALLAGTPILILARKDFPPKDLKEFVAYVKANEDQGQRGACRRRLGLARVVRAAELRSGRQADRRALQRHRTGDERAGGGAGRLHVRPDRQRGAADQRRHHQGLCDRDARAQSVVAECSDHDGSRPAGVPGPGLERDLRAEGNAARRSSPS